MKVKVILCMGSSCHSRGNDENLEVIKHYFKENNITDKVEFKGQLCTGNCNDGPVLKINNKKFPKVEVSCIPELLDTYLMPLLKS